MGDPSGFLKITERKLPKKRAVEERLKDYQEIYLEFPEAELRKQASRCMDCGVPFCHQACPLGNIIPDWNDLVFRGLWGDAIDRLHATNNFPEFTGRVCPAPCEVSCVLGINQPPVTIKQVEVEIAERAWKEGWIKPETPKARTGKKVAVVGSGPAGLAAADQLNNAGHRVTVFERDDRIGGLLRYGIPDFKMEKHVLDRRLRLLEEEGVEFRVNANVGFNVSVDDLRKGYDAILLAGGATKPRDLHVPGRDLGGIHFAMEYLTLQNKRGAGDFIPEDKFISAEGKNVVIIGGGDTGADCLGTANRQGARRVVQLEIMPRPPEDRAPDNPWPQWSRVFRWSPAHEEGVVQEFAVMTKSFSGEGGRVRRLHLAHLEWVKKNGRMEMQEVPAKEEVLEADLVLLAMGFLGPETDGMLGQLGVKLDPRGNVAVDANRMTTVPGVFAAGDMSRGQSLVVWAISEGREAARGIDLHLMGRTDLPEALPKLAI